MLLDLVPGTVEPSANIVYSIGRLSLEDQHCLPAITEDTTLEYLIPTTSGAGACTTSLVDYLMLTHNDFIEKCQAIVAERNKMCVNYSDV